VAVTNRTNPKHFGGCGDDDDDHHHHHRHHRKLKKGAFCQFKNRINVFSF